MRLILHWDCGTFQLRLANTQNLYDHMEHVVTVVAWYPSPAVSGESALYSRKIVSLTAILTATNIQYTM